MVKRQQARIRGLPVPVFSVALNHLLSILALGQIPVMGGACELNIRQAVVAATAVGTVIVVILETVAFGTATTAFIHVSALPLIALVDSAFDRGRDVARR